MVFIVEFGKGERWSPRLLYFDARLDLVHGFDVFFESIYLTMSKVSTLSWVPTILLPSLRFHMNKEPVSMNLGAKSIKWKINNLSIKV